MIQLRLADDSVSAPEPIPFPGRSASFSSPGRSAGLPGGRSAGRFGPRDEAPTVAADLDKAFARVQRHMDELFELAEVENPLPMKQWRWDPDDGPSAA